MYFTNTKKSLREIKEKPREMGNMGNTHNTTAKRIRNS
jgi:hypothetical protein